MTSAKNQHVQRIILLLKMTLILCLILLAKTAPAAEQIDQSHLPEWGGGWTHVNPTGEGRAAMWQTFTPACTNVIAVEIDILTINPGRGDDVLTVEIAKDGDTLASAERSAEDGFDGLLRFDFPEAAPLVPEQVYELTVRDTGKNRFGWKYGSNTYERGSRYVFAEERSGSDWFFRTYSNVEPAVAKYSGGSGTAEDPYQIATATDLMLLGETPEDYDKRFILTADVNLDPNLPGRKVFNRAVIAPDLNDHKDQFQGTAFTGIFDGNGHTISHLTIKGSGFLGLFGQIGLFERLKYRATISNLGLEAVDVSGMGDHVGGLVGFNYYGSITNCYSTGAVTGGEYVGGLFGSNNRGGSITASYSNSAVTGDKYVGGLVGCNGSFVMFQASLWVPPSRVADCFSNSTVKGDEYVGGLVGVNYDTGSITNSYSTGAVSGDDKVGGLVGGGDSMVHGGDSALVTHCAWDMETSGQSASAAGAGLTTSEMMDPYMLGLNGFANDPNWILDAGHDYPRLVWEGTPGQIIPEPEIDWLEGQGTAEIPYRINTADQLIFLGQAASALWDKHFVLAADIDLNPNLPCKEVFYRAVFPAFLGVFDGNDHTISHLTISGDSYLGLFGQLGPGAIISNLVLEAADIKGTGSHVGSLAGHNRGSITDCFSSALVSGNRFVGGLVGENYGEGSITSSYSTCAVTGDYYVGGLVGQNGYWGGGFFPQPLPSRVAACFSNSTVKGGKYVGGLVGMNYDVGGNITNSYSTGQVSGDDNVGGLVGRNACGSISNSYSTGAVTGYWSVGGLVGRNSFWGGFGTITNCYSTGMVTGDRDVGGLVGDNWTDSNYEGSITSSFWDTETSCRLYSNGGIGKTTVEMQTARTFLEAGWDFVDESENGTEDIWWILEGQGYPRLWWEAK